MGGLVFPAPFRIFLPPAFGVPAYGQGLCGNLVPRPFTSSGNEVASAEKGGLTTNTLKGLQGGWKTRRIYTTFILSTALLNFGTRANDIGHGPLDFCRVKANFSARVPKNLGGPRPPREVVPAHLKRGPRAETRSILVPRVFALMTDQESKGSGLESELRGTKIL